MFALIFSLPPRARSRDSDKESNSNPPRYGSAVVLTVVVAVVVVVVVVVVVCIYSHHIGYEDAGIAFIGTRSIRDIIDKFEVFGTAHTRIFICRATRGVSRAGVLQGASTGTGEAPEDSQYILAVRQTLCNDVEYRYDTWEVLFRTGTRGSTTNYSSQHTIPGTYIFLVLHRVDVFRGFPYSNGAYIYGLHASACCRTIL